MEQIRMAVILFGVAVAIVIAIAYVTTLHDTRIHTASNAPAGTVGLAKPHPAA